MKVKELLDSSANETICTANAYFQGFKDGFEAYKRYKQGEYKVASEDEVKDMVASLLLTEADELLKEESLFMGASNDA